MASVPLQISFHNMRRIASVEREIAERVEELRELPGRILGCHASVEMPHKHHQNGNTVEVRVSLALAGELIVTRKSTSAATPARAVHLAFDAIKRQMGKAAGKRIAKRKAGPRKAARVR